jgi:hypothetical protein
VLVWYKLDEHRQRRNNHQPPKGPAKD